MISFEDRAEVYKKYRRADERLVDAIENLLSLKKHSFIADIGAGIGSYSIALQQRGYNIFSIEPETAMRKQNLNKEIKWINSYAENIDLPNDIVNGAIIINAIHHFTNLEKALKEVHRIIKSGPLLIFTFNPEISLKLWLFDYWPELKTYEINNYPNMHYIKDTISKVFSAEVKDTTFDIPWDFTDLFSAAAWKRPNLLFDKDVRGAMSLFNCLDYKYYEEGIKQLRNDLLSGLWQQKYNDIIKNEVMDVGCRILLVNKNVGNRYER